MISHPRLRSLLAMYQLNAGLFVEISRIAGFVSGYADAKPGVETGLIPAHTLSHGETNPDSLAKLWDNIRLDCVKLGLGGAATSCGRIKVLFQKPGSRYKALREAYDEFQGRLRDELNAAFCLAIEARHIPYYSTTRRFGNAVGDRFPTAADDIEEAGKCLALGRSTACVFHLMRALEIGLQAFAQKLEITLDKERNWQLIINSVNGSIKRLPSTTHEEKEFLARCSAAALFLQQAKDAWRNDVMHPRATYSEEQAEEIDGVAKSLMGKLAEFV